MKKLLLIILSLSVISLQAQDLKIAKLKNGLSVYIWEDSTATKSFGQLSVKAGSIDDPEEYTGLAHYLEHVMFKGTDRISTLDWSKEKPLYEQIIAKYDEMAEEADPIKKNVINKEINKLTVEASKFSKSSEFSSLIESFGGSRSNASTSYDYTTYFCEFPTSEIEKWLELFSSRLINPVFRAFQTELETVYEEYNRGNDDPGSALFKFLTDNMFAGTPYARPILGTPEHLKNPRISKVIDFYNTWYVPENMALILVGNIKSEEILPIINRKFSRLAAKPVAERKLFENTVAKGKMKASAKIGTYPSSVLIYEGSTYNSDDFISLEICSKILSNSSGSGLLDKLSVDGELLGSTVMVFPSRNTSKIIIQGIPSYDYSQMRFASHGSTEKMLLSVIDKLKKGNIEEWLINSVKTEMFKDYELNLENIKARAELVSLAFLYDADISTLIDYKEKVFTTTVDDIKRVAKKYFANDFWSLTVDQGTPKHADKMKKPDLDPIKSPEGSSVYSQWFAQIPNKEIKVEYPDMDKVQSKSVNSHSKIFYSKNEKNDIFSLSIRYGIGSSEMKKLSLATNLMNNAGVMAQLKPHEFKEELGKYGASIKYRSDDNYLYVEMLGIDEYLQEACNLLTRQILMPELDEKQLNSLLGSLLQSRRIQKKNANSISNALLEYMKYQDKSDYLDVIPSEDVKKLSISDLVGEFQRATNYSAEIFYAGALPFDEAYNILSKNLPLKEGEIKSNSPQVKERQNYSENTIYFTPNTTAEQSQIHFYIEGEPFDIKNSVNINFFNQYFSGGFGSVVIDEIREKNSLAYSTYGIVQKPLLPNKNFNFTGFIGTQGDKTLYAIDMYLKLLNEDLIEYDGRVENVKGYMIESYNLNKASFRSENSVFETWKRLGYTTAPAETEIPEIKEMTFEKVKEFHSKYLKGKPIVIGISGNPKYIDVKALEKFGKVERLPIDKIFSKD